MAVAGSREGSGRQPGHDGELPCCRRCRAEERTGTRPQRFQDRSRKAHAVPHVGSRRAGGMTMAGIIGQPVDRIDGPLKVSGRATYAAEYWNVGQPLYGFIVGATIGKGRITTIDTARAERELGVRMVMTHRNAPAQGEADPAVSSYSRAFPTLSGPDVHHY